MILPVMLSARVHTSIYRREKVQCWKAPCPSQQSGAVVASVDEIQLFRNRTAGFWFDCYILAHLLLW